MLDGIYNDAQERASISERQKGRNILAAIRTLKQLDGPAPDDEGREHLRLFPGFGCVALSIFPDPLTRQYKDAFWEGLGADLAALLTPEEYASARRTTFNAFYTSPLVMRAAFACPTLAGRNCPSPRSKPSPPAIRPS
jgi:hypothetical protein